MAETLARTEPVPTEPLETGGVTIALEAPMARYSLRARDAALLGKVLGGEVPTKIGTMAGDIICLGPDEWLLRRAPGGNAPQASVAPVSVVDISERQIAISIDGPAAIDVMRAGSPLDIERFSIGSARRTIFETVEIVLIRESETRFVIECWRSFAEFVWTLLAKAAREV